MATSKGGVGKTTLVTNLAAGLALRGMKVLCIDCDAQGNLQNQFHIRTDKSLGDLLMDGEVEVASVRPNLDLINSGKQRLADAEVALASHPQHEAALTERLSVIKGYDVVFCDLSPTITLINTMALHYCDYLLVPISMSFYSITGAHQILHAAETISTHSPITPLGIVLNLVDSRTNLTRMVSTAVREKWGDLVFDTAIRRNVAIEEAPSQHATIFEHAPRSIGAEDFSALADELIRHFGKADKVPRK